MNRYFKNFIVCVDVDQYCLLCKETFTRILEIEKHVRWEQHRLKMKALVPFTKYVQESIHKVENIFYCEVCNIILPNMKATKEHVKSEHHKFAKKNPNAVTKKLIGCYDKGYVLIDQVVLSKAMWHAIVDNTCHICDVSVNDVDEHVALETHMIKFLQCETKHANPEFYRKITEDKYHCWSCKAIYSAVGYEEHLSDCDNVDESEVAALQSAKTGMKSSTDTAATTPTLTDPAEDLSADLSADLPTGHAVRPPSDLVAEYDGTVNQIVEMGDKVTICDEVEDLLLVNFNDFFIIDTINKIAKCLYCSSIVGYNLQSILVHVRDEHHTTAKSPTSQNVINILTEEQQEIEVNPFDNGKKRSILAKYGRDKHIKLNFNGTKGYCTICDKYLSASMRVFEEHLKGLIHMGHLELLNFVKPNTSRVRVEYFTENMISYVKTLEYAQKSHAVIINDEIYLKMNNFLLVSPVRNDPHFIKTKCYVCQKFFDQGTEADHCLENEHKDSFVTVAVLPRPEEFVRMIRPNLFHCGICNITLPFSKALETHMLTKKHKNSRIANILLKSEIKITQTPPGTSNAPTLTAEPYSDLLLNYCDSTRL